MIGRAYDPIDAYINACETTALPRVEAGFLKELDPVSPEYESILAMTGAYDLYYTFKIEKIFRIENPALEARFLRKHNEIRSQRLEPTLIREVMVNAKFAHSVVTNGFLSTKNMSFHSTIPMAYGAYNSREASSCVICEVSAGKHRVEKCEDRGDKKRSLPGLLIPEAERDSLDSLIYTYLYGGMAEESILVASFEQVLPRYLLQLQRDK